MDSRSFASLSQYTVNGRLNNNTISRSASGQQQQRSKGSSGGGGSVAEAGGNGGAGSNNNNGRRKKPCLSARERNVRRIESNERERLRMHGLNEAFQVGKPHVSALLIQWL